MDRAAPRPIRVLIVASHPVQYTVPLYRAYAEQERIDVTVAYCSLAGAERTFDPQFGMEIEWDVPLLEGYRWIELPNWARRFVPNRILGTVNPSVWGLIRRERFDVVLCFSYRSLTSWIALLAARSVGAAFLWSSEAHNWLSRAPRGWKEPVKRRLVPWIYRRADACIAVSSATVRFLDTVGVHRVFLTPFAVDTRRFSEEALETDRAAMRERYGIPSDVFLAILVGKLIPYKRPWDLLEAAALVPGVHVAFAGEGELRGPLEGRARELGIEDRSHFLGFVNQAALPAVYAAADVMVVPSEWENYPLVVPEAVACGLPIILTDMCSAAGDVAVDGSNAFVVAVGDVSAIVGHLRALVTDPGLRAAMSADARDRIQQWTPQRHAAAFADACMSLTQPADRA